jgi:prolyl-tRNA synthetase
MRWSKLFIPTSRQSPTEEARHPLALLARAGYAHIEGGKVCACLPLGARCLRRIRELLRTRLLDHGGQEFCLLDVTVEHAVYAGVQERSSHPATAPYQGPGPQHGSQFSLQRDAASSCGRRSKSHGLGAPEERTEKTSAVPTPTSSAQQILLHVASSHLQSYKELPQMWFHFAPSPQGYAGTCVVRSLCVPTAEAGSSDARNPAEEALSAVIESCGLNPLAARSLTEPGREQSATELLCLSPDGEVEIAHCPCGYAANLDCAISYVEEGSEAELTPGQPQLVATPKKKTIADVCDFLNVPPASLIKSLLYIVGGQSVLALVRGDDQLNESLLCQALGSSDARPADADEVQSILGAEPGSIGPVAVKDLCILADLAIRSCRNAVCGANKDDYHLTGVEPERDFHAEYLHLRRVCPGDPCPECRQPLSVSRARCLLRSAAWSPVSDQVASFRVLGPDNRPHPVHVSTCMLSLDALLLGCIEQFSDADGIVLPPGIAPFDVVITPIRYDDERQKEVSNRIYRSLSEKGVDVLLDDRDAAPGVKFKDADLIGVPLRVTVGPKKLREGNVELRLRATGETRDSPVEDAVLHVTQLLRPTG